MPWLALLPPILYALAPKCPACLAAYFSMVGVTVGMTSLALAVLEPLAVASIVVSLGFAVWRVKPYVTRVSQFRPDRGEVQ
jgi:hypothetical protein